MPCAAEEKVKSTVTRRASGRRVAVDDEVFLALRVDVPAKDTVARMVGHSSHRGRSRSAWLTRVAVVAEIWTLKIRQLQLTKKKKTGIASAARVAVVYFRAGLYGDRVSPERQRV